MLPLLTPENTVAENSQTNNTYRPAWGLILGVDTAGYHTCTRD